VRNRVSIGVLLRLPLAEAQAAFGPWGSQASAVDAQTTRWSVEGESIEHLFGALAWIPAGVEYTLEGDAELLQFVGAAAAQATASVRTR
jgi:hypothetical protein